MTAVESWVRVMRGADRSVLDRILHFIVYFSTAWESHLLMGRASVVSAVMQVARVLDGYTTVDILRGHPRQVVVVFAASVTNGFTTSRARWTAARSVRVPAAATVE